MGRKRRSDTHLHRRVYLRHGTYYFVDAAGQWHALGRDLPEALAKYGQKIGGAWSGRTLGDVIDRYRTQVLPLKRSSKTRENEAAALTRLKRVVGHMMPDSVQPPMLYRYIDERRKKDGSSAPEAARHEIALLGHVYAKAIRWGAAVRNPVRGLEKFARKGKRPPVPVSEVEKVKALASERMRLAIDLAVCLGPRRGDLLKLTQANLTDDGIMFRQGKTQREQLIEWSADLKGIVARGNAMAPQIPNEFLLRRETASRTRPPGSMRTGSG